MMINSNIVWDRCSTQEPVREKTIQLPHTIGNVPPGLAT